MEEISYATQSNYIRHLNVEQYKWLYLMCIYSNNLYNEGLYQTRQRYFDTKEFQTWHDNCKQCKTNSNFKLLQNHVAQLTLKEVADSFASFFGLLKKRKDGEYNEKISIPHYRKKGKLASFTITDIWINNDGLKIPVSKQFAKQHPGAKDFRIPFPDRLKGKKIKLVHILPVQNGLAFKAEYVYIEHQQLTQVDKNNAMALDPGVDNIITAVCHAGSWAIDGHKIKSINRHYNKRFAELYSKLDKDKGKDVPKISKLIKEITDKRNRQVRDYILKVARIIVNLCLKYHIGTLVIGVNKGWKQHLKMGHVNNQTFAQIPMVSLRTQLKHLCWKYSIDYIEQEESYTSLSSYLDNDPIPVYGQVKNKPVFSGKRIKRGLYRTKDGSLINADCNGAANILRKQNPGLARGLCMGVLAAPQRIWIR